jgi:ribosomal protein S30
MGHPIGAIVVAQPLEELHLARSKRIRVVVTDKHDLPPRLKEIYRASKRVEAAGEQTDGIRCKKLVAWSG